MIPLFETSGFASKPLGMVMCQNRLAVPTWSHAMETYPPARILEIGTYSAGLAVALGVHAYMIGAQVITYDRARIREGSAEAIARQDALAAFLGVDFRIADVWESEPAIAKLITSPGRVYVLCDGGDKPRELATFAKYLKAGDIIAAHDCGTPEWPWCEITREQGDSVAAREGLEPWRQDYFNACGWLVYQRPIP